MLEVRHERECDAAAIRAVLESAFPTDAEARLVNRLRAVGKPVISLVALAGPRIVGQILFTRIECDPPTGTTILGLAPLAVDPAFQGQGIGSRLVGAGIQACRDAAVDAVVVLGEPEFYGRFGFHPASQWGLRNEYGVDEPFMLLQLSAGPLPPRETVLRFAEEFGEVEGERG